MIPNAVVILALAASPSFTVEHLSVDGEVRQVDAVDLDGDGRLDVVAVVVKGDAAGAARSLAIYWNDGKSFSATPNLTVPVASDLCAYDFAELDAQPGAELLEVTPDGVRSVSFAGRRAAAATPVISEATVFVRAAKDQLPRLRVFHPLGAAMPKALLVPGLGTLSVYTVADGRFVRRAQLPADIENQVTLPRRAGPETLSPGMAAFSVTTRFPQLRVLDLNGDGRPDVALIARETVRGFLQTEAGFSSVPNIDHTFTVRTASESTDDATVNVTLAELNGDGLADALVTKNTSKGIASAKTEVSVFYASASGFRAKADQRIETEGAAVTSVQLADISGDGKLDLLVPSVRIGLFSIIRVLTSGSMKVDFQLHPMGDQKRFSAEPTASRDLIFQLKLNENHSDLQAVDMTGDFDGDGHQDLAFGVGRDELALYRGAVSNAVFSPEAMATVSVRAFGHAATARLNGGPKTDLLLWYPETTSHQHEISLVRAGP